MCPYLGEELLLLIYLLMQCSWLFKESAVALLLSNCKFQAFIISFLPENKAKVTSEHDSHKPVAGQHPPELRLFLIKER